MKVTGKNDFKCGICTMDKMSQYRDREPDKRATCPLEFVHCDLTGPIDPAVKDGFRYALSFVDDYSGINMVYFLKQKSDTIEAAERFLADTAPYGTVKHIRSDNGTEFTCKGFKSLLVKYCIKHETSAPYLPHQNGTVERGWRSLFDMARCLLLEAKLPKVLQAYAVMVSAYICNRCYNPRTEKTPYEVLTVQKPDLGNMHVFGTTCYAYVQNKKELDARSEQSIFVGYDKGSPAYLVYFVESKVIKRVQCVKFTDKFDEDVKEISDPIYEHVQPRLPDPVVENKIAEENENNEGVGNRYPQRQHSRPNYLDDYITEPDADLENLENCKVYH